MKLHHLALGAHDVESIASFYSVHFELQEVARHVDEQGRLRSIWLRLDDGILMVEKSTADPERVVGIGHGIFLIAFGIAEEERAAFEDRLRRAGFPIDDRTEYTSYLRDPEGNRVALSHYPL